MTKRPIAEFVEGLSRIAVDDFTLPRVSDYLHSTPVDPATLSPYLHFAPTHYTRNLIHRCRLFELMAICWDVGQASRIHNHAGQSCWMAAPIGRLVVQSYEVVESDGESFCRLREARRLVMGPDEPACVLPEQPIHAVLNPREFGERAVSLHVYSRPYDRCLVYGLDDSSCMEVPLFFDTVEGEPVPAPSH